MPARRTRSQSTKAASAVSLDTVLLATAIGAGVAAYFFLDAAPEVVATSCIAAVVVVLIYGGKVQKYVRGRKPKAAKKAAPKSPKPTRVQPKRSATPEPLSRKPSSPKKKPAAKKPRAASPAPAKKPAVKKSPARKPAAKKPATRKAAVSPKKRGGSRATLEALASARSTPASAAWESTSEPGLASMASRASTFEIYAGDARGAQDDARDVGRRLQEQRLHEVPPAQVGELARGELKHSPPSPLK